MNTKKNIIFSLLKHSELKMFQSFIQLYWSNDHIFVNDETIFNWQHKGKKEYHYMISKQNDEIIGVHGIIPLNLFDRNLPENQIFLALWRVLENKGIGIGLRMFKEIIKKYNPEFIAGLPINASVLKFYQWQGFKCVEMNHCVFISPYITDYKLAKVPNNILIPKRNNKKKIIKDYKKLTINNLKELNTHNLYNIQTPLKSDEYIINRYMKHPVYNYEIYAISDNINLKGLCIIRRIIKNGSVVLSIKDFIGENSNFPLIKNLINHLLKKYNAEYVDIYSYGLPLKYIYKAGFVNRKHYDGLIIPSHYEPFEQKNIDINIGYINKSKKNNIRVFKGDGDADRPSILK